MKSNNNLYFYKKMQKKQKHVKKNEKKKKEQMILITRHIQIHPVKKSVKNLFLEMVKISKNTPLLKKLRLILANKKYHNAIRWSKEVIILIMNQGSEIEILNIEDIVNRILARFFNTNQYRSFHKSLIDYGFKYIKYTYKGVFYHPSYRKDTSYLDDFIKSRTTIVFYF